MKIKGLNDKEQKCFNILKDGEPHKIGEMKRVMVKDAQAHCAEIYEKGSWDDSTVDSQAQSYVRNSIRRLIRDGWVKQVDYGTYRLTPAGKKWVAEGKDTTKSFGTKRGRKPGTKVKKTTETKAKTASKSKKAKTAPAKAKTAPAKAKTAPKSKKVTVTKAKAPAKTAKAKAPAKTNGKSTKPEAKKEAKKAKDKSAMLKKAQAAKKRVGKLVALEKAKAAQKSEATAPEAPAEA